MPLLAFNHDVVKFFADRLNAKRLAHAYLLIAPTHAGKFDTAMAIASVVNCQAGQALPCGQCASCMKIANNNHPDIMVLAKDEDSLKVEHVRGLLSRAQLRAYEARMKVFVVPDCERMTIEAANAFLKTLEEPAANTLMLLTISQPEHVLATVKSRCQWVRFAPEGQQASVNHLTSLGADQEEANFIARFSDGWVTVGESLHRDGFYARKKEIVAAFLIKGMTDELIKDFVDEPDSGKEALRVLSSLIRDAFVLQATHDEGLVVNDDQLKQVKDLARYTPVQLSDILRQVKQIKVQIDENLNAKMAWQILKERLWNTLSK